jgi:hypothetical protein
MKSGRGAQKLIKENDRFTFVIVCLVKLLLFKHFALVGLKSLAFLYGS